LKSWRSSRSSETLLSSRPTRPHPLPRSGDPGDDHLLALAETEKAIAVSGDRHLLKLADRFPIRSPRAFLEELEANSAR
jgi:predicted nucleic acid-binding protein